MSQPRLVLGVLLLSAVGAAFWLFLQPSSDEQTAASSPIAPSYPSSRTLQFGFTLKNTTRQPVAEAKLWVDAPVLVTAGQQCCSSIDASRPYRVETDSFGNQRLRFDWPAIAPYATEAISIRATVNLSLTPNRVDSTDPQQYLGATSRYPIHDPGIANLARTLTGPTPTETARRIFDWTVANIRDAGYTRQDRGALYALEKRQGDCTEFMDIFIALARANGIPARGVAGYVAESNLRIRGDDYHNWAMVYLDGRWHVVDPQRRVFMENTHTYIAFRLLDGQDPVQSGGQRFEFEGDGLGVRMN